MDIRRNNAHARVHRERHSLRPEQRAAGHDHHQRAAHLGPRILEELGRQLTTSRRPGPPSPRTRVARLPKRGHYDRATIDAILDGGLVCHVGIVHEKAPVVIPTLYWREGDHLYLHGSAVSRMLDTARTLIVKEIAIAREQTEDQVKNEIESLFVSN